MYALGFLHESLCSKCHTYFQYIKVLAFANVENFRTKEKYVNDSIKEKKKQEAGHGGTLQ
jgi:protein-arginine kinase activator protein McsA